ncbi:hypothetical protein IV203_008825 [Nitzschia inconspicua]|uniref:Uncharacterized protein n=1 Tax=Nitzschia inconspicua TaxID=303405 RepID=A0A9K3L000_9STRA|nr:hypothetical protein IV203_008825 [Nitzschia inconspicua]
MSVDAPSTARRLPTLRSMGSTLSSISDGNEQQNVDNSVLSRSEVETRVQAMVDRAKEGVPLTEEEIHDVVNGVQNLVPKDSPIDFAGLRGLLKEVAHLSHKNWGVTSFNSDKLLDTLSISSTDHDDIASTESYPLSPHARQFLERILTDGNWDGAVEAARIRPSDQAPWAVLVTGVNGIRKTTSMYQPWFEQLLSEALIAPSSMDSSSTKMDQTETGSPGSLPTGSNSFFRQLDHMICTVCNEEFGRLYKWAASELPKAKEGEDLSVPSAEIVERYSEYKAAIFMRYRTLSELLGALLLKQAQLLNINCMMETSGRDVTMFHYVDHFFDSEKSNYNKLALHFTINDLECAKQSVDRRMIQEIQVGAKAIESGDAFDIVYTNEGGPYGSKVLAGVQKDSDKVWKSEVLSGNVGKDWFKATIAINAHANEPWTAQAVKPDGSLGTLFTFERKS